MKQEDVLGAVRLARGNSSWDQGSGLGEGKDELVHIYLRDQINKMCLLTQKKVFLYFLVPLFKRKSNEVGTWCLQGLEQ